MGDPHHYEKAARYARAAWLGKSAPGPEKLGISYPGVPGLSGGYTITRLLMYSQNMFLMKAEESVLRVSSVSGTALSCANFLSFGMKPSARRHAKTRAEKCPQETVLG